MLITQLSFAQKTANDVELRDTLPPPYATSSVMNFSNVIGWEESKTPIAPEGFSVTRYADSFQNPRWM